MPSEKIEGIHHLIRSIEKISEEIDTVSFTKSDAWREISERLGEVREKVSGETAHYLAPVFSACINGAVAVAERTARESLDTVGALSETVYALGQVLAESPRASTELEDGYRTLCGLLDLAPEPLLQKAMDAFDDYEQSPSETGNGDPSGGTSTGGETVPEPPQGRDLTDHMPDDPDFELLIEFVNEGSDLIASAEEALLTLETDPDDEEAVGKVFRAFHTVKGTSAFLELTLTAEMGHLAESLLSRVRDREIRYSGGYADLALRALDMIKDMIVSVGEAIEGASLTKPDGYDELMQLLRDPEKAGISDQTADVLPRLGDILVARQDIARETIESAAQEPRVGDILVAQGKVDRKELEQAVASYPQEKTGMALVKSDTLSAQEVGQALRTQKKMKRGRTIDSSVRVSTNRLDRLIDLVGELVIAHSMVAQDQIISNGSHHDLLKKVTQTTKIVKELQDMTMSMRMIPLKPMFSKMTRLVRDVSKKVGKEVNFITEGEETEIDRNLVDVIGDPLIHMVRNAVDHGIETPAERQAVGKPTTGQVKLAAYHSAGSVVVEITDDGKGMDRTVILEKAREKGLVQETAGLGDREVFNLVFEPGFSTAEVVTDVSGRGVGMDVVRKNIESLRGQVEIQSERGRGSVFKMSLPLTLAIIDGMVIRVGGETYVVPTVSIIRSIKPEREEITSVLHKGEMLSLQGELIPLFRLTRLYQVGESEAAADNALVVVVEEEGKQAGLVIDELVGRQQVVIKSLGETMVNIPGIAGGAILPSGRVGLILDVASLVKLATS